MGKLRKSKFQFLENVEVIRKGFYNGVQGVVIEEFGVGKELEYVVRINKPSTLSAWSSMMDPVAKVFRASELKKVE